MERCSPGHLRHGDTCTRLAAAFGFGVSTAWRHVREAADLLALAADDLATAMGRIRRLAYAILDGTPIAIDRVQATPGPLAGWGYDCV